MNWWEELGKWSQTQLGAGVASGLILLAVAGIPRLHRPALCAIRRWFSWIVSIRITTAAGRAQASEEGSHKALEEGLAWSSEEEFKTRASLESQLRIATGGTYPDESEPFLAVPSFEGIRRAVRASVLAERLHPRDSSETLPVSDADVSANGRTAPVRDPRWAISEQSQGMRGVFVLSNLVTGSIATEVRLETVEAGRFEFQEGAHWDEVSGGTTVDFMGERIDAGWSHGVPFSVHWTDANNKRKSDTAFLRSVETPY